jgi:membrane-associated protein
MGFLSYAVDFILHVDVYLKDIIGQYGAWTYLVLFIIIFCETGLVVTPFLPGDSLLFAAGALAALGALDPLALFALLVAAAILGDASNYWIGKTVGPKVLHDEKSRIFRKSYLDKTHAFFEKHGGKSIILARFVPIVRTFAPFLAGVGTMSYSQFLIYNVVGGVVWVGGFVGAGYFFGNLPYVRDNFTLVVFAIVGLSVLPPVVEWVRHRFFAPAADEPA